MPIDPQLDRLFHRRGFSDVDFSTVRSVWRNRDRDVIFVKGYFPESAATVNIHNISFAHVDVDLYQSVAQTLEFLSDRFLERSIVVFDDYLRRADGVIKAVGEFTDRHPQWVAFPIYPGQGLMINRGWL